MSNYLDYETTRLLPENPYNNYPNCWWISGDYLGEDEPILTGSGSIAYDADGMLAWTWEDVRLYFDEKGYTIVQSINSDDRNDYCFRIWKWIDGWEGEEIKEVRGTYEKARLASIQYCLNLINNENIHSKDIE